MALCKDFPSYCASMLTSLLQEGPTVLQRLDKSDYGLAGQSNRVC